MSLPSLLPMYGVQPPIPRNLSPSGTKGPLNIPHHCRTCGICLARLFFPPAGLAASNFWLNALWAVPARMLRSSPLAKWSTSLFSWEEMKAKDPLVPQSSAFSSRLQPQWTFPDLFFSGFKVFPSLNIHHIGLASIGYKLQPNISVKGFQSDSIKLEKKTIFSDGSENEGFQICFINASPFHTCGSLGSWGNFCFQIGNFVWPLHEIKEGKLLSPQFFLEKIDSWPIQ